MVYENGVIYTLRSHQTDKIYIGSTTQPLYKRIHQHKRNLKAWKNGKFSYVSSFELMKYDDVYIELLEIFPCSSKMELHKREGELQREIDCINKNVAGRKMNEYRFDNKEKIKIQKKEYDKQNKDKKKEYVKQNIDEIKIKKKEYYQNNKDKILEHRKEFYEKNKDKVKEYYQTLTKFNCDCGGKYRQSDRLKHFKTKKHQKYILNVEKLT